MLITVPSFNDMIQSYAATSYPVNYKICFDMLSRWGKPRQAIKRAGWGRLSLKSSLSPFIASYSYSGYYSGAYAFYPSDRTAHTGGEVGNCFDLFPVVSKPFNVSLKTLFKINNRLITYQLPGLVY